MVEIPKNIQMKSSKMNCNLSSKTDFRTRVEFYLFLVNEVKINIPSNFQRFTFFCYVLEQSG